LKYQVLITEQAYGQIQREVNQHPGEETGGVLIGFQTPHAIVITNASGPGPGAVHLPHAIQFDESYCERRVRQLQRRGKHYKYIGDWHSHPYSKLKPSKIDQRSFFVKSLTHYRISSPLMIITGPGPLVSLEAFLLKGKIKKASPELIDNGTLLQLRKSAISYA
jgi:integrative and conjugative element protein (TIGR02256 family)